MACGLTLQRLNDLICQGCFPGAPVTKKGTKRRFDLDAAFHLFVLTELRRLGLKYRKGGSIAQMVACKLATNRWVSTLVFPIRGADRVYIESEFNALPTKSTARGIGQLTLCIDSMRQGFLDRLSALNMTFDRRAALIAAVGQWQQQTVDARALFEAVRVEIRAEGMRAAGLATESPLH